MTSTRLALQEMPKGVLQLEMKDTKQQHNNIESIEFIGKDKYIDKYRIMY